MAIQSWQNEDVRCRLQALLGFCNRFHFTSGLLFIAPMMHLGMAGICGELTKNLINAALMGLRPNSIAGIWKMKNLEWRMKNGEFLIH